MTTLADPLISEFESNQDAERHDQWFRAQVQVALAQPGLRTPHILVMAQMDEIIAAAEGAADSEAETTPPQAPRA